MILDLTKENLQKNGFSEIEAENILKQKNESIYYQDNSCIISSAENKIYTEIDFYRKEYLTKSNPQFPYNCPDLVNEYFDLALAEFLEKQKTVLGILFNKTDQTKNFISNEIQATKERINSQKEYLLKMKLHKNESKENDIQICEAYIDYLKAKQPENGEKEINFLDYIHNVKDKEAFALELKETFNTERGQGLKNVVDVLKTERIIELTDGQLFAFHKSMKSYFNRDIGVYEAYRKAKEYAVIAKDKIVKKLKPLIDKHKNNQ